MLWPPWMWIGTPMKFSLWLANRIATWTGAYYVWKRWRRHRYFWPLLIMINVTSIGALGLFFYWLHMRASH